MTLSNRPDDKNKPSSGHLEPDTPVFFPADAEMPETPAVPSADAEPVSESIPDAACPPETAKEEQVDISEKEEAEPVKDETAVPDEPVSLGAKASQFEQTKIMEEPAMISLSEFSDAPVVEDPAPSVQEPGGRGRKKAGHSKGKGQERRAWGCFKGMLYAILVVGASLICTYMIIGGILDVTGLQKSDLKKRVDIAQGATTTDVADALEEAGIIDQKLIFRLYSKLTKADGKYQPGTFYLSASMGYGSIIDNLQEPPVRATVTITIPEGSTVENVARILSEKEVCDYEDFYAALVNSPFDYEFLKDVPKRSDKGYEDRIYWLEGYLFPDTYEFYVGISGEEAINKLLSTFDAKLDTSLRTAIKASGRSLDEVITLASIVQGEAADAANMPKVARVILNRLENYAEFPYLQCDSTGDYLAKLSPDEVDIDTEDSAYDTYTHMGLPPGPINNPSLAAIKAVVNPSKDKRIMKCYYFANDSNRNTYYSETYEEHVAICERYGIGIHAK